MELLGYRNPSADLIKSKNEFFKIAGADRGLFNKFLLMATGKYIAAPKEKNKVILAHCVTIND